MNALIRALIDLGELPGAVGTLGDLQALIDGRAGNLAGLSPSNDDFLQRKAGAWTNRTVAQVKADLGLGDIYGVLAADYTLTSTTSAQKIFNWSTNGAATLTTGVYEFDMFLMVDGMSATSGNAKFDLLGAGAATLALIGYASHGDDAASSVGLNSTKSGTASRVSLTAGNLVNTTTAVAMHVHVKGSFDCTGAGTIIPSILLTTAIAAVVKAGSHFRCRRLGATGVAVGGTWT